MKTIDVFYALVWIAALFGIVYVYQRLKEAAKRKIFNRTEYEEGQKYVSETLIVETLKSANDMMQFISDHVSKEDFTSGKKAVIYESSRFPSRIAFAYGNQEDPKIFEAAVVLTECGTMTSGKFNILIWGEKDGIISGIDAMRRLREQVNSAFIAVNNKS